MGIDAVDRVDGNALDVQGTEDRGVELPETALHDLLVSRQDLLVSRQDLLVSRQVGVQPN